MENSFTDSPAPWLTRFAKWSVLVTGNAPPMFIAESNTSRLRIIFQIRLVCTSVLIKDAPHRRDWRRTICHCRALISTFSRGDGCISPATNFSLSIGCDAFISARLREVPSLESLLQLMHRNFFSHILINRLNGFLRRCRKECSQYIWSFVMEGQEVNKVGNPSQT